MAQQEKEKQQQATAQGGDEANQGKQQPQAMTTTSRQQGQQGNLARRDPSLALLTANPFALMRRFTDEMDRIFGSFSFGSSRLGFPSLRELASRGLGELIQGAWSPQIEVVERDGQLVVRADLPGLKKEDIKVEIRNDTLIIQGERKQEQEEKREGFYRSERSYGTFMRAIPLPEGVNTENVTARFQDGVLEITMPAPQREPEQGRQVQVQ
jgi:HSP20 family protein